MLTPKVQKPSVSHKKSQKPRLIIDKQIARGKFSVFHAKVLNPQTEYAVKAFPTDLNAQYFFAREKRFVQRFNHPNIIKYASEGLIRIHDQEFNVLIMEYAPFGDFYEQLIASEKVFDECLIRGYFQQLVTGVEYLHSQGIAHFDLKPENLLIGKDYQLKITDFDQTQVEKTNNRFSYGTAGYRAPEVIERNCNDIFAADVYSMGVVLYVLIVKQLPFIEKKEGGKITLEDYDTFCEDNERFWRRKARRYQNTFDVDFCELMNGMLKKNPSERMTLEQVKASRWFNGLKYSSEDFRCKIERLLH